MTELWKHGSVEEECYLCSVGFFFYVVNLNAQASWNVSILLETCQQVIMLYVPQRTLWPPEEGFIDQDS